MQARDEQVDAPRKHVTWVAGHNAQLACVGLYRSAPQRTALFTIGLRRFKLLH